MGLSHIIDQQLDPETELVTLAVQRGKINANHRRVVQLLEQRRLSLRKRANLNRERIKLETATIAVDNRIADIRGQIEGISSSFMTDVHVAAATGSA